MEVEAPRTEKSRPGESWTWAHFIKPEDKSKKEATCKICNDAGSIKVVSTANGTNVMKNHLNTTHKIFKPVDAEPESKKPRSNAPDDRLINILLTNFFGECHIPLSVVDHPAFIELLSTACPTYKLPTRNTLRSRIIGEAANIKNMIKTKTVNCRSPSYCADLWKSKARDYYVGITLQFIDDEWKLWNIPLGFPQIIGRHTAVAVGSVIADVLQFYLGEGCTPFAGVIDGGDIACVKETAKKLNCEIHDETCICHQLNNIIKKMLNDYFEKYYLQCWRTFVKRLHQSKPFEDLWVQCCQVHNGKEVVLQSDSPTRWSSTVSMLGKATTVKLAVERMFNLTANANHHEFVPDWGNPQSDMWTVLDRLVELFQPTLEAIKLLEGEKYITQSLILLQLCALEKSTKALSLKYPADQNKVLHLVIKDLTNEINELWDKLPIDTVIASILDPRTKFFPRIPAHEITEALKTLSKEFKTIFDSPEHKPELQNDVNSLDYLFEDLKEKTRNITATPAWKQEMDIYKSLPRPNSRSDPLQWWKIHNAQLPVLAQLAKRYLAIPASQASCERLFSISGNDVTENRTSMTPELVESLLFVRKKKEILEMLK